ncbi:MAG: GNAT family N-acetyltransferase [Methanobacteriota archaeon]|nr:MAG: GNAT family N-acetyltransferase [Euryarchaeota archaeon]
MRPYGPRVGPPRDGGRPRSPGASPSVHVRVHRHIPRPRSGRGGHRLPSLGPDPIADRPPVAGVPVASGCAWIMDVQPHPGRPGTDVVYLLSMFTEPGHRGEGHATRIVRAAMRWAKVRGISLMVLHASEFGESIYRRLGFERTREMRRSLVPAPRRSPRSSRKTGRRARRS